jgi:DNA polymerase III epsilon subunit-like protein
MRVLVFDTETTGLPKKSAGKEVTFTNEVDWPHIVQFSYVVYNTESLALEQLVDEIIKVPKGVEFTPESVRLHGITPEKSNVKGKNIDDVLLEFTRVCEQADVIVAHNIAFDINMIKAEFYRILKRSVLNEPLESPNTTRRRIGLDQFASMTMSKTFSCTMRENTDLCDIRIKRPDNTEYKKYPTLSELHAKLFNIVPSKLHNSLHDVIVCLRCFYKVTYDTDICERDHTLRVMMTEII